ncbi:phytoene desaturase [Pseudokineococcus lusitanus]|uniref:Phytoene desaturase n=1 Tax=Pseudokineococcus lusitanus TaxID=763993 RepID=A0A3N1HMC7_9ACTN|nr:phytoene desaturase family protein [Pseudokineococcus lusitanus]ROP43650.1 phytoene desaturase [Pseudokineococcus lusitanus]
MTTTAPQPGRTRAAGAAGSARTARRWARWAAQAAVPGRVRTTSGPSDHVVVVGAGLAGLSAAMHLAGAGRRVTVLEREAVVGGRAGRLELQGPTGTYRFDPGPTVLTMPDLIADCFDALGEEMSDRITLDPVSPLYRAQYADGTSLDVHADAGEMAAEVERVCGPAEARGYLRYVDYVSKLYRAEMKSFIDTNIDTPLDLVGPDLARLAALGGFGRMAPRVERYLKDPRTQRAFSFQALYAGMSPYDALALYAVIAYMDSVAGVFFPRGGVAAVPEAMAAALRDHGVDVRTSTEVTTVEHSGGRASAVVTADGERIACDALVLNPDLPVAFRELLGTERRSSRRMTYSPSCYLLLAGSTKAYPGTAHHTISFGHAWEEVFAELTSGRLMSDPSVLISTPSVSDPTAAPEGRHTYYVLFPTPNLQSAPDLDWERTAPHYREHVMRTLEARGFPGFADGIEVEDVTTPLDWQRRGMEAGAPFAASHAFSQTGPFRPGNIWGENVVLTGSGTQPGVGVPMVLVSGRLAAERITGKVPGYRSRAYR